MGGDSHTSAQIVIDEFDLPLSSTEYLALREVHLVELFASCPEISGAGDFVMALADAGIPIGLATSSHRYLRDIKLKNKVWGNRFNATVCGDDTQVTRGKPAPDIFLACAAALGAPPANCIAFEDSRNGIKAARAAGMQVVGMNSPYVTQSDLAQADVIIDAYAEVMCYIKTWRV